MSDVSSVELVDAVAAEKRVKKKARKSKVYPKKLYKKTESEFEFSGRVECINAKTSSDGSNQFTFSLAGKKGDEKTYLVETTESAKFSAMISLLSAASVGAAKVKVRSKPNPAGPNIVTDIEIRPKSGIRK